METKRKNIVIILTLLAVLGIITFIESQADDYTFSETMEFKPITPALPEVYTGPQTVPALMTAYDAEYDRRHPRTTVSISGGKSSQLTVAEIDTRYPRAAWLQMLLKKGITIKNFHEYASALSKRHTLVFLEDNPDLRKSGFLGMPLTDDWETYKDAYIDKLVSINTQIQNSVAAIEAAKVRVEDAKARIDISKARAEAAKVRAEDAKVRIEAAKSSRWNSVLTVPNGPIAPIAPIAPRVPQLFNFNHLTELEEIPLSSLRNLVNQLEQRVEDLERQNRWKAAEQAKGALEHVKEILEQTEIVEPSFNEPKRNMRKTSRYPPL
jgi:hypothetical protein